MLRTRCAQSHATESAAIFNSTLVHNISTIMRTYGLRNHYFYKKVRDMVAKRMKLRSPWFRKQEYPTSVPSKM